ncbi:hypothetical protein SAMN04487934_10454 [Eubacterium ruminantium]|nr:hypothetical protein SAMN04487934_10454 [Eubacterium ruminantium]
MSENKTETQCFFKTGYNNSDKIEFIQWIAMGYII